MHAVLTYVWFLTKLATVVAILLPPVLEPELFAPYVAHVVGLEIAIALLLWRTIWLARKQRWFEADIFLWLAAGVFFGGLTWWNVPATVSSRAAQRVMTFERRLSDASRVEYPDRERDELRRTSLGALRADLKNAEYRERAGVGSPEFRFAEILAALSAVNVALAVWWFKWGWPASGHDAQP